MKKYKIIYADPPRRQSKGGKKKYEITEAINKPVLKLEKV